MAEAEKEMTLEEIRKELPVQADVAINLLRKRAAANAPVSRNDLWAILIVAMDIAEKCAERHAKGTSKAALPGLSRWAGIYSERSGYSKDAMVAHAHGLWIAEMATAAKPGTPGSGWRLIIKGPR